jgi:hypothetical protein
VGQRSDLDLTAEGQASIFVAVDHCSTECIGIHAARRATRFEALKPIRQGVRACFGAFAEAWPQNRPFGSAEFSGFCFTGTQWISRRG